MRRLPVLCLIAAAALAGCGEGGAASGATVSVYAAASLCGEARRVVDAAAGKAGDLEVRVACLPRTGADGAGDLAAAGANARRATEDAASVAFLEAPGPAARFSQSIVEAADIAWIESGSGAAAMRQVLRALEGDSSSPRKAVLDEVG